MMACNAILGALLARARTGKGQSVEVALFDNAVLMTGYAPLQQIFTGKEPRRPGNTSPDTCPSGVFQASDKPFYISCGNDKIFQRLVAQVIGLAADAGSFWADLRVGELKTLLALAIGDEAATLEGCDWVRNFDQLNPQRRAVYACIESLIRLADIGDTGPYLDALRQLYGAGRAASAAACAAAARDPCGELLIGDLQL